MEVVFTPAVLSVKPPYHMTETPPALTLCLNFPSMIADWQTQAEVSSPARQEPTLISLMPSLLVIHPLLTLQAAGLLESTPQKNAAAAVDFHSLQVHVTYKTSSSVIVSWSTGQGLIHSTADANSQHSAAAPSSTVWFGTSSGHYTAQASSDATTSYQQTYNFTNANPNFNYSSPLFHHVALQGLIPDTSYFYKCGDSGAGVRQEFNFTSPPAIGTYPFVLGVVSDTGLTPNTTVTIQHLVDAKPQVWTLIGDFS